MSTLRRCVPFRSVWRMFAFLNLLLLPATELRRPFALSWHVENSSRESNGSGVSIRAFSGESSQVLKPRKRNSRKPVG